jgi:hypothetical protein
MTDDTPLLAAYRQVRRNAGLRAASTGRVDGITAALADRDRGIATRVAAELRPPLDPGIIRTLIAMLALSRDEGSQKRHGQEAFIAQNALLRAGRPAAGMLLDVMQREDEPVHRPGGDLLAGEDVDRAIGVLIEAHARQPRRFVGMAAGIIGTVCGPDAIGTITAAATRGPDELRFSALWILVHIDNGAAIEPLGRLLPQEVGNPGNTVVLAARGLGRHRAAPAIQALIQALPAAVARDDRGELQHEIALGLRAGGALAVSALITLLREGTNQLRLHAARNARRD